MKEEDDLAHPTYTTRVRPLETRGASNARVSAHTLVPKFTAAMTVFGWLAASTDDAVRTVTFKVSSKRARRVLHIVTGIKYLPEHALPTRPTRPARRAVDHPTRSW